MIVVLTGFSSSLSSVWNIISLILIFIFVLALAYFSTKIIAKYQSNTLNSKSNIKIIESFRVGNNKYIAIAEIAGQYYALAIGKDEINLIGTLDKDNIIDRQSTYNVNKTSFKDILSKVKNNNSNEQINKESSELFEDDNKSRDKNEK